MTPADDTNCDAYLPVGTFTVNIVVALNQSGGTYTGGTYGPQFRASIWAWDVNSNTGVLHGNGITSPVTWDYTPVTGDLGTFKNVAITISNMGVPVTFAGTEILVLQLGLATGTVPNPTIGTATWTATLRVDTANTNITWASGQNIVAACALSGSLVGAGVVTRNGNQVASSRSLVGAGVVTRGALQVARSHSLVGAGVLTQSHAT